MNALLASAAEILKFETALLLLVTAGLLVLAKIVSDLRAEVRGLRGPTAPENRPLPAPATAHAAPSHAMPSDEIPADVFTAIVSAVYCTLDDQHRIVSVSPAESLAWSREGRRSIFRSHTFR
jgi:hypothetical protein